MDWLLLSRSDKRLSLPIYRQLLARLYRTPQTVMLGAGACIASLGGFAALRAQDPWVGVFAAIATACVLLRLALVRRAPRFDELSYQDSLKAEARFWFTAVGSTCAVGALGVRAFLVSDSALVHLLVVALALATMAIALRNYSRPRLVAAQLASIVVPGAVVLLFESEREYWVLGLGAVVLSYMIGRTAVALGSDARRVIVKDQELSEQNRRFEAALNNMAQGLCMFDAEGRLLVCNQKYLDIYRFSPEVVRPGIEFLDLLRHSIEVGNYAPQNVDELHDRLLSQVIGGQAATFWNELADGRTIALSHEPMKSGGWVITHEDITERRRAEAQIAYMARHDALTDLPNRVAFQENLGKALRGLAEGGQVAVLCLDLDRFKSVNDTLGHAVGDAVLCQVAERLKESVRENDTVARIGGDEFAIIQGDAPQPESAAALAARIVAALDRSFCVGEHEIGIGCSVGASLAPDDTLDADRLLKNADLALYEAKAAGRGQHRFFVPELDRRVQSRRTLEMDLRQALLDGEFEVHYQPLVRAADVALTGFEALLRWNHPRRGVVLPGDFVALTEEIGLIVPLGDWVLRQACAAAADWPAAIRVCVNLSPAQFRSGDLVHTVTTALATSGIEPDRLELEITEGVLLDHTDETLQTLHRLRNLGVRIAMDDFGTGYSSLSYLRAFPFDKIKIDQSFVQDMLSGPQALSIVRAAIDLGRNLGMITTAEGIETIEQFERIRAEGCSEVQGFLFGKPMNATSAAMLLKRSSPHYRLAAA